MRLIERLSFKQFFVSMNSAYKRLFDKESADGKLILRDIVGFAKLGLYDPNTSYTPEQMLELRGRQQMALHMLRHLDIDAARLIELQNEAYTQANNIDED